MMLNLEILRLTDKISFRGLLDVAMKLSDLLYMQDYLQTFYEKNTSLDKISIPNLYRKTAFSKSWQRFCRSFSGGLQ